MKYFNRRDMIWLPHWNRLGTSQDGLTPQVIENLERLFSKMDQVREALQLPIIVHCAWRPEKYNSEVGGARKSAHLANDGCAAVDFHVSGITCHEAQQKILSMGILERLGLRMEDNGPAATWVHLDDRAPLPGHPRFFLP